MLNKLINIAKGELGVKETGVNICKYNDWYWGEAYRKDGASYPWCVVFLAWVFDQAGVPFPHVAHCNQIESYAKSHDQWQTGNYKAGDAVIFDYDGDGNRDHTGLVIAVNGDQLTTIEGNYGDMVAQVKRRSSEVVGAYRADFKVLDTSNSDDEDKTEDNPDTTPVYFPTLQNGDYGYAVGSLQVLLKYRGMNMPNSFTRRGKPDCEFGSETAQVLNDLFGTDIVTEEIWRQLIGGVG